MKRITDRATKENLRKSVWSIIKEHGWFYIGSITTALLIHYYVTTAPGGSWPETSLIEFIISHIKALGGIGATISILIVLQNWLRGR